MFNQRIIIWVAAFHLIGSCSSWSLSYFFNCSIWSFFWVFQFLDLYLKLVHLRWHGFPLVYKLIDFSLCTILRKNFQQNYCMDFCRDNMLFHKCWTQTQRSRIKFCISGSIDQLFLLCHLSSQCCIHSLCRTSSGPTSQYIRLSTLARKTRLFYNLNFNLYNLY